MKAGDSSAALLGLVAMPMYGKRGLGGSSAAVLDAPEPDRVQRMQQIQQAQQIQEEQWPIPEPAPAGTLQRRSAQSVRNGQGASRVEESPYQPRRESLVHKLRLGLLTTVGGRILGGSAVVVTLSVVALAVVELRSSLLHDARFAIASSSEIQITGTRHLTRAQVLSVFGADLERNIFKIPMAERQADLERLPWVAHATVMRLLPDGLRIAVTERTPVAFVRQGSRIGLVDGSGVLLDMPQDVAGDPHYSFPVLTGLAESDPLSVRAARMEVYRKFMQELDSSGEKLTESLSEVDVSNPEDVKAVVTSGGADVLVHFGDQNFLSRYKLFAQNLPQWKTQYPKLASVDTRYESEFVLEMQPGSAVPLAGDGTSSADTVTASTAAPVKPARDAPPAKRTAEPVKKRIAAPSAKAKGDVKSKPAPPKKPLLVHDFSPPAAGKEKQ